MLDSPCIQVQIRSLRNDHILEYDVPCRQMRVTKSYGGSPLVQESLLILAKLRERDDIVTYTPNLLHYTPDVGQIIEIFPSRQTVGT